MTSIKRVIINAPNTLFYDFGHPLVKEYPELLYTPIPGAQETLDHLAKYQVPVRLVMNQAGPLYGLIQPELIASVPGWQEKQYPNAFDLATQIAPPLKALGFTDAYPIFISVYNPWIESPGMLNTRRDVNLPHIGQCLADAGLAVAIQVQKAFREQGLFVDARPYTDWRLPETKMLKIAQDSIVRGPELSSGISITNRECLYIGPASEGYTTRAYIDQWAAEKIGMQFLPAQKLADLFTMIRQAPTTQESDPVSITDFGEDDDLFYEDLP